MLDSEIFKSSILSLFLTLYVLHLEVRLEDPCCLASRLWEALLAGLFEGFVFPSVSVLLWSKLNWADRQTLADPMQE